MDRPTDQEIALAVAGLLEAVIAAGAATPAGSAATGSAAGSAAAATTGAATPAVAGGAATPAPAAGATSWFRRMAAGIAAGAAGAAGAAAGTLMTLKRPTASLPPPTYAPPAPWDSSANRLADLDMGFAASFYDPAPNACAGRWIPTSKCTQQHIAQDVSSMELYIADMNADPGFERYAANFADASGDIGKVGALHKKYPEHRIIIDGTAYPIANPYLARGARALADATSNIVRQNSAILEQLARPHTGILSRFDLALLESLWFCSSQDSLSNDRRCLPLRLLGELHEQQKVTGLEEQRQERVASAAAAAAASGAAAAAAAATVAIVDAKARELAYLEAPKRYGSIGAYPFPAPTSYGSLDRWKRYRY